jgi:hypothetical protein
MASEQRPTGLVIDFHSGHRRQVASADWLRAASRASNTWAVRSFCAANVLFRLGAQPSGLFACAAPSYIWTQRSGVKDKMLQENNLRGFLLGHRGSKFAKRSTLVSTSDSRRSPLIGFSAGECSRALLRDFAETTALGVISGVIARDKPANGGKRAKAVARQRAG